MDRLLSKPPSNRGKMVKIMNNEIVAKLNLDLSIILSKILPPVKIMDNCRAGPYSYSNYCSFGSSVSYFLSTTFTVNSPSL